MASPPAIVDALIIGAGPAGLNAALALARTRCTAYIFDSQEYRNQGVTHMHTVASRDHFSPASFRQEARSQIESRYSTIFFKQTKITAAEKTLLRVGSKDGKKEAEYSGFKVTDSHGESYLGHKIILATGSKDIFPPDIPGYAENWPSHIYQCLGCDGYEQRGTPIGILGFDSPMQAHIVQMATAFDPRVTIYSNGPVSKDEAIQKALTVAQAHGASLDERKVVELVNNGPTHNEGVTVHFETGEPATLGFIVHRPKTVNRAKGLLDMLGVETVEEALGGHVKVLDGFNETNVKGVFAAGDTMVAMKQVAIAMANGLQAGVGAMMQLGKERSEKVVGEFEELEREKMGVQTPVLSS